MVFNKLSTCAVTCAVTCMVLVWCLCGAWPLTCGVLRGCLCGASELIYSTDSTLSGEYFSMMVGLTQHFTPPFHLISPEKRNAPFSSAKNKNRPKKSLNFFSLFFRGGVFEVIIPCFFSSLYFCIRALNLRAFLYHSPNFYSSFFYHSKNFKTSFLYRSPSFFDKQTTYILFTHTAKKGSSIW